MKKAYKILFIWSALLTLLIISLLEESNALADYTIEYFSENESTEDNTVEKVFLFEDQAIPTDVGSFVFNAEKGRYECNVVKMQENKKPFWFQCSSIKKTAFQMSFRLCNSDAVVLDEGIRVSRYINGKLSEETKYYFRDYMTDGAKTIHYVFHPVHTLEAWSTYFGIFGLIFIALWILYRISRKQMCKIRGFYIFDKWGNSVYLQVMLFFLICVRGVAYFQEKAYIVRPDTKSYCIDSLGQLGWFNRTPVYQFFLFIVKKVSGSLMWEEAFPYVVKVQVMIAILGIWAFYYSAQSIFKSKRLSIFCTYVYSIILAVYGYLNVILTEAVACSLMSIMVWLIVQIILTSQKKYIAFCCIMTSICVLSRPSFLFLLPLVGIFLGIFILWEHKYGLIKCSMFWGGLCVAIIVCYCKYNEKISGHFMVSSISYHNQLAIMLENDMYRNENFPDISMKAEEIVGKFEGQNYLSDAVDMCNGFGYSKIAEYLKSCRRQYLEEYIKHTLSKANLFTDIILLYRPENIMSEVAQKMFDTVRIVTLPFNFIALLMGVFIELLYAILKWIREKKLYYMSFGLAGCILAIYITSVVSLYAADIQRYMVHIIPLVILLVGLNAERLIQKPNSQEMRECGVNK